MEALKAALKKSLEDKKSSDSISEQKTDEVKPFIFKRRHCNLRGRRKLYYVHYDQPILLSKQVFFYDIFEHFKRDKLTYNHSHRGRRKFYFDHYDQPMLLSKQVFFYDFLYTLDGASLLRQAVVRRGVGAAWLRDYPLARMCI